MNIEGSCIKIINRKLNRILTIVFSVNDNEFLLGLRDEKGEFFSPLAFRKLVDDYGLKNAFELLKNFGGKFKEGQKISSPAYDPKAEKILCNEELFDLRL